MKGPKDIADNILQSILHKSSDANFTWLSEILKKLKTLDQMWTLQRTGTLVKIHVIKTFLQLVKCVVHSSFDVYFDDISNVTICENTLLISPWNDKIMGDFFDDDKAKKKSTL